MAEPAPGHLLLIGMMGSGKTTAGRELASRLGRPYLDSDEQVVARAGRSVAEIFADQGESAFRAEEKAALAEALSFPRPAVVSVAGGAVLDPDNRAALRRSGTVVWLRARVDTLAQRVGNGAGRPLLADDPRAVLTRLDAERRLLYRELATVVVDVDELSPPQVVHRIVAAIRAGPAVEAMPR
jgi:shikimate kinase